MKKVLSTLLLASATIMISAQAQVLVNENFESLTIGNVGTDVTGATAGQGGIYLLGGTPADYQIATIDATHGKSLRITSGNGAPPPTGGNTNERWTWKNITTTASAANNLTVITADIFTGPATGSGSIGLVLFGSAGGANPTTQGGIKYNYATKKMQGIAHVSIPTYPPAGTTGTLTVGLGDHIFPANTWVTVQYRYNKTTGEHSYLYTDGTNSGSYTYNGGNVTVGGAPYPAVVVPNLIPDEADIVNTTVTGNTVANIAAIDNWSVQFTNQALLGTSELQKIDKAELLIYPNPVSDILNIKTKEKVQSASIFDMTGRKIEAKVMDNAVDVTNLERGTYIINIQTEKGTTSEKFIKK